MASSAAATSPGGNCVHRATCRRVSGPSLALMISSRQATVESNGTCGEGCGGLDEPGVPSRRLERSVVDLDCITVTGDAEGAKLGLAPFCFMAWVILRSAVQSGYIPLI